MSEGIVRSSETWGTLSVCFSYSRRGQAKSHFTSILGAQSVVGGLISKRSEVPSGTPELDWIWMVVWK